MKNKTQKKSQSKPLKQPAVRRSSKLLIPHSRKCFAKQAVKQGQWDTEWSGCLEGSYWGNILGARIRGRYLWHIVTCNDTQCKGRKAVNAEVLNYA